MSLTSHPNVDMDEVRWSLCDLGAQDISIFMNGYPEFPSGSTQAWNPHSSNELQPTQRTTEEAIAECEKFFFDLRPGACISTIKNVAKEAVMALSKDSHRSEAAEVTGYFTQTLHSGFTISTPSDGMLLLLLMLT
jgi:hypothetical protein